MVYGNWPDSSKKNTIPFFTASYTDSQRNEISPKQLNPDKNLRLVFIGALIDTKRPLLSIEIAEKMIAWGYNVKLDFFGDGVLMPTLRNYINKKNLTNVVVLHGNQPASVVIEYYKNAHFLIFLSKTEGWPKVVAEAMWWGCLPITTAVSCVPEMVGNGTRGSIIEPDKIKAAERINFYFDNPDLYADQIKEASRWAQQFTLENFEEAITNLLK